MKFTVLHAMDNEFQYIFIDNYTIYITFYQLSRLKRNEGIKLNIFFWIQRS